MYESSFSYHITRPYPYKWFTWVVVIGGIVITILLSVLNLAANGYESSAAYVTNPNETEYPSNPSWNEKKPWSWAQKVSPTCQAQTFKKDEKFYTSNRLWEYTITNIMRESDDQFFTYKNDGFHYCAVYSISIWGADGQSDTRPFSSRINCTLFDGSVPIRVTLETSGRLTDTSVTRYSATPPRWNNHTQASLFWGTELIGILISGWPRKSNNASVTYKMYEDVNYNPNFGVRLQLSMDGISENKTADLPTWISAFDWEQNQIYPPYSNPSNGRSYLIIDTLAKLLHATILTDLGQSIETNILTSPQKTMEFAKNSLRMLEVKCPNFGYVWKGLSCPFPSEPLTFFKLVRTGEPSVAPSGIYTQYFCTIPKLKSPGYLFISVLVADLVLLQAIWIVFTWIVNFFLQRRDPLATYCPGCAVNEQKLKGGIDSAASTSSGSRGSYEQLPHPVPGHTSPMMRNSASEEHTYEAFSITPVLPSL